MDDQSLLKDLHKIFNEVFNRTDIELKASTSAKDIQGWDSLNHAILIDRIAKHFGIKFDLMDMLQMQNVGQICERIQAKKKAEA